ncbi:MAG: hypothetical protein RR324_07880 [Cellulosilyticaceae bacterium]
MMKDVGKQSTGYRVVKNGNKFKVNKLMGEYDTKREAVSAMLELLRKDSHLREKEEKMQRMKGLSRYF